MNQELNEDVLKSGEKPELDEQGTLGQIIALADRLMDKSLSQDDISVVQEQLGRFPRGMVAIGARCVCGRPLAVVTRPLLPGGIPFPTTCYLSSPEAVKAVSYEEGRGLMRTYTQQLAQDCILQADYSRAHGLYLAFRTRVAERLGDDQSHIEGISAGGMPSRIKCLHALVAQSLVMGGGINPIGDATLAIIRDRFNPDICRCLTSADRNNTGKAAA